MAPDERGRSEEESRRILSDIRREPNGSKRQMRSDPLTPDAEDWTEQWGRRIGMVMGPLLFALAALWFVWHLATGQSPE